jgi:hypothetical protein
LQVVLALGVLSLSFSYGGPPLSSSVKIFFARLDMGQSVFLLWDPARHGVEEREQRREREEWKKARTGRARRK